MKGVIKARVYLRDLDLIAATVFMVELGDLRRFASYQGWMTNLGLSPSDHSSGNTCREDPIANARNKNARRIVVEATWPYRLYPRVSRQIAIRQQGPPEAICDIA